MSISGIDRERPRLILASASPRRLVLLEQIGIIPDETVTAEVDEAACRRERPGELAARLAEAKARQIAARFPGALVLGADTVVVHEGVVLGKPEDEAEAHAMLRRLSGETHTVFTGLALLHPASDRRVSACEATRVTFDALSDEEIRVYVASGAPMDKAGAYGIQGDLGAVFVTHIEGDFYTVMGLPLHRLYRLLHDHFPDLVVL